METRQIRWSASSQGFQQWQVAFAGDARDPRYSRASKDLRGGVAGCKCHSLFTSMRTPLLTFCDNGVTKCPNPVDGDLDDITRCNPSGGIVSSGPQDVAGMQRHVCADGA